MDKREISQIFNGGSYRYRILSRRPARVVQFPRRWDFQRRIACRNYSPSARRRNNYLDSIQQYGTPLSALRRSSAVMDTGIVTATCVSLSSNFRENWNSSIGDLTLDDIAVNTLPRFVRLSSFPPSLLLFVSWYFWWKDESLAQIYIWIASRNMRRL